MGKDHIERLKLSFLCYEFIGRKFLNCRKDNIEKYLLGKFLIGRKDNIENSKLLF